MGQAGNYIANLDPASGAQKRYEIEEGTNPHTLIVHQDRIVWYAGNRNGRIGRLDPATGATKVIMTEVSGTIRHMHFDRKTRSMWFGTDANNVGRIALQKAK